LIKECQFHRIEFRVNDRSYILARSLLIFFFLVLGNFAITCGSDFVSEEEKKEKGAVCELDEREFTVLTDNHAVMRVHRIFTVYNQNGTRYGEVHLPFTKFVKADKILAEVKTTAGKSLKKLKKKDIREASRFSQYQFYTDEKERNFDLSAATFPYVLEYNYEIEYLSLFFWQDWLPQMDIPVRRSVYFLSRPKNFGFKMYQRNLPLQPLEQKKGGNKQTIFELHDLPPFKAEQNMPPAGDCLISVTFTPDKFKLGSYQGSSESWNAFGKWYSTLAEKQYVLSHSNQSLYRELVKDITLDKDRVKVLYQYLQSKMRYVAIGLGISGWQPREAESVATTCYGDCKYLSTLFIAMLRLNGIKAYPALIRTRYEGVVLADFPSNQFDHVITFVPLEAEMLWLDCTCSYCPFGELPAQDEGCQALVVMDDTAALIETPTSLAEENKINRSLQAKLGLDGSMEVTGNISATGNFESYYCQLLNSLDAKEKREWLGRMIGQYTPNHTVLSSDFEDVTNPDIPFSLKFAAKLIQYPTKSGKDLLVNLNLLSRVDAEDIPKEKERKYPVDNQDVYTTEDEVTFEFPEDFIIHSVPEEQDIKSPYGSFQTQYQVDGNKLTYKRTKTITRRLIEPAEFQEYKEFLGKMYKADHSFVVFAHTSKQ